MESLVEATPSGLNIEELIGFSTFNNNLPGVIALVFKQKTMVAGFNIGKQASLISVSWPNLVRVTGASAQFLISNNTVLTSISAPLLESVSDDFIGSNNLVLPALSFPSLVTVGDRLEFNLNVALKDVSLPVFVPKNNQQIAFNGCALTQASVDHILARCVASVAFVTGTVDLGDGTNATPSAAGLANKAILEARGVTVQTN